jgi:hypothetical protein
VVARHPSEAPVTIPDSCHRIGPGRIPTGWKPFIRERDMHLRCRFCREPLAHTFVDLGSAPPCQRHLTPAELDGPEVYHPLHVRVCARCFLVQLPEALSPQEIFGTGDYAYFSGYSESWVAHAERFAAGAIPRFGLGPRSRVVEIASNDGYLLQHFAARGIPVLGVEPAANCAAAARKRGIPSLVEFFGEAVARRIVAEHGAPDLVVGNNVLAHVPDLHDFVAGLAVLCSRGGVVSLEFPHLLRLVEGNQFDTIYHEHYSYLGFGTVDEIFCHHGRRRASHSARRAGIPRASSSCSATARDCSAGASTKRPSAGPRCATRAASPRAWRVGRCGIRTSCATRRWRSRTCWRGSARASTLRRPLCWPPSPRCCAAPTLERRSPGTRPGCAGAASPLLSGPRAGYSSTRTAKRSK